MCVCMYLGVCVCDMNGGSVGASVYLYACKDQKGMTPKTQRSLPFKQMAQRQISRQHFPPIRVVCLLLLLQPSQKKEQVNEGLYEGHKIQGRLSKMCGGESERREEWWVGGGLA